MRNLLFIALLLLISLIEGVVSTTSDESKRIWPVIEPVKKTFHFVDRHNTEAKLKIVGTDGTPLYLLECYLNAYDYEDRDFDYSGDFECRLTSLYSKEVYSTLLTEEQHPTRDWESRGRFLIKELMGRCAQYPEYGRLRHFTLRGMNLALEIKNFTIKLGSKVENSPWYVERIEELDLEVAVTSDPKAASAIAEPTHYVEPPRAHPDDPYDQSLNCEKVLLR